jgi:hypothetical protein
VQRLSLERDRVAVVHASRACVLADGAGRDGRRKAVNFSEWAAYSPDQQRTLLAVSCDDATSGKMPGPYRLVRPETRLSVQDVETICAAARQTEANTADRRRER